MSGDKPPVALRPARADDEVFLARVYASTRAEELEALPFSADQKAAFLAQQFAAQTAHYATHYADASYDVVLVDGKPAGRLIVMRSERELLIVDISLLPEYRSRGIGSGLLRPILGEADARGAKVTIHVERLNRALRLYARLGFVPAGDNGVYLSLERPPAASQAKTAS